MSKNDEYWNGSIYTAKEHDEGMPLSNEDAWGRREYPNHTYGESDFTVRPRKNNKRLYDVYTPSDESPKGHTHDVVNRRGKVIDSYHDTLVDELLELKAELAYIKECLSESECHTIAQENLRVLKNNNE